MARFKTLTSVFKSISKEEREASVQREFATLKEKLQEEKAIDVEVVKRPVGRPKRAIETILQNSLLEEEKAASIKKVRGTYNNWFGPSLWGPIHAAVRKHRSISAPCNYLKSAYKKLGEQHGPYEKLSRGSMYEWFCTSTWEVKEEYKKYITEGSSRFSGGNQHCPILSKHPTLQEKIIRALKSHRQAGQSLFARSVRNLILSIIKAEQPSLLGEEGRSGWNVSLNWVRSFVKDELNWTIRKATTAASKLPKDWELQGLRMAQRVAYLAKCYAIPKELVVNTNQTGINLVPTCGIRTWEEKGSKYVAVLGVEDNRQITMTLSSSASGDLLPFQVIFSGKSSRSLPPLNQGRMLCEGAGWHITNTENHWSNLTTCKEFVKKILEPYRIKQVDILGLRNDTSLIWLIDCWTVHTSATFTTWLKETYPQVKLLYVPANCTSIYQLADVILQRPFKYGFREQFDEWSMEEISKQLGTCEVKDVKLNMTLKTIKPELCRWLYNAWTHINNKRLIQQGWKKCGLSRAFEDEFQARALKENMVLSLFKDVQQVDDMNTTDDQADDIEPCTNMLEVMEKALAQLCINSDQGSASSSITSLRKLARKSTQSR